MSVNDTVWICWSRSDTAFVPGSRRLGDGQAVAFFHCMEGELQGSWYTWFAQACDTWALCGCLGLRKDSRQRSRLTKVLCRRKEGNAVVWEGLLFFPTIAKITFSIMRKKRGECLRVSIISFYSPFINKYYNKLLLNLLQLKIDKYVFRTKIRKSDVTTACWYKRDCVKNRIHIGIFYMRFMCFFHEVTLVEV